MTLQAAVFIGTIPFEKSVFLSGRSSMRQRVVVRPQLFYPSLENSERSHVRRHNVSKLSVICEQNSNSRAFALSPRRKMNVTCFSNLPDQTVYGGPQSQVPNQRVTLRNLDAKYTRGEPIVMVTAYDYPSAVHVDLAGIDICLVGDSASMVVHGHDTTLPITLEEMLTHCRAVARGARRPLLVGDMPFGSYEQSTEQAVSCAIQILKRGHMDAVKLEGGIPARVKAAKAITDAGIAVMGHVGLTPQAISSLGGFRPQGKTAESAMQVLDHALALQSAGCFSLVLECVPSAVAAAVTRSLSIPTIGIGAGVHCSGQVLVYHDLLGMMQHPHHAKVTPKFSKAYANVGSVIQNALCEYREEVKSRAFPSDQHSPYMIPEKEVDELLRLLAQRGLSEAAGAAEEAMNRLASEKSLG